MLTKEMLSYIAENIEDIKRIIRDLCAIPAPSHHEEKRAEYCKACESRAEAFCRCLHTVPGQRL